MVGHRPLKPVMQVRILLPECEWDLSFVSCQLSVVSCGLWVVGCGLWVVGCGLWVVGQPGDDAVQGLRTKDN